MGTMESPATCSSELEQAKPLKTCGQNAMVRSQFEISLVPTAVSSSIWDTETWDTALLWVFFCLCRFSNFI